MPDLRGSWAVIVAVLGIACSPPSPLKCGPGTHEEAGWCLPDATSPDAGADEPADAGMEDAGTPERDGGLAADAGQDAGSGDGGVAIHNGDPCPSLRDVCQDNVRFACGRVPQTTQYGKLSREEDCSLLAGTCTLDLWGNSRCRGGPYDQPCDRATARDYCFSSSVRATCNTLGWRAFDCSTAVPGGAAWHCEQRDAGAICAP